MDRKSKSIRAAILGASASVISVGLVVLDEMDRNRNYISMEPRVNNDVARERYINSILFRGEQHCINQIRMRPATFFKFCDILVEKNLLSDTANVPVREQVLMFLHQIGHNVRFRVMGGRFHRSTETIHKYFKIVLEATLRLYKHVVRQPGDSTPPEISSSQRFYPYFKDCVGALDGTHIRAKVPLENQGKFRGRKEGTTQNVLAAITFDLKFVYVLAGWEGSAHDSRILDNALARPRGFRIPEGKYYLGDAGYGIRNGIIPPYRGVRYHLKEFSDRPPETERELFNLRHSSLRTTIERGFGILKKRFRVLDAEPFWSYGTQVNVVLACCTLHNFIMGVDPNDPILEVVNREVEESQRQRQSVQQTKKKERDENREWALKRDEIASKMWNDYII